ASGGSGGFDSHTLPPLSVGSFLAVGDVRPVILRRFGSLRFLAVLGGLWLGLPARGAAQDSALAVPPAAEPLDSAARRPGPMGSFWRSFLIPGWGQARLGRKLTGGMFVAWEGVTLGMSLKTRHELAYLRRTDSERAEDKRREHEDWIVLLAFNHLFSGLEAYVSGHLTDFPEDLRIRAIPGGAAASVTVPFLLR
ncbi:MAG: hypothetical protein ACREMG_13830, partial [Gemmatimonadales bacterium]